MPSALQSPVLRRIIAAYAINRLGTWIGLVALSLAVFAHTHSALAVAGLLFAWQALPAFVVPAVVARVEASARRSELSGLYFFEALATGVLVVLLLHFWLPAVLLVAALDGTASLAASALLRAELARSARAQLTAAPPGTDGSRERLAAASAAEAPTRPASGSPDADEAGHEAERSANAALNVAFSVTFVVGPALGGVLVAATGGSAALLVDVGSFLACGALLIDLHPYVEHAAGSSVRARLHSAWRHINEAPSLRGLLLVEFVAIMFAESAGPIQVAYSQLTLKAGDRGYGLLLGAWGAGAVLGSLVFARSLKRPLGSLLSAGTLAVGLAYVGFAASPSLTLACVAALIGGVGNGVELPSLTSIVQRLSPTHLHGQMMGAVESMTALCLAVGLPLGGALVALSSPRTAFLIVGLGAAAASAALFRLSRGSMRSARRDEAPAPQPEIDRLVRESTTA